MGANQSAIDSPTAADLRLHLLGHVDNGVHGEGLHGSSHRSRQALLEKTRQEVQLGGHER